MADKHYFFCAGIPRTGSTLLLNCLAQNPDINVTGTSGILNVLLAARNAWSTSPEFRAADEEQSAKVRLRVLKGIFREYFAGSEATYCADKSRGWAAHLEMAEAILETTPKVIVTVRDLRDVLASCERLYRKTKAVQPTPLDMHPEPAIREKAQTLGGRCELWAAESGLVGSAYRAVVDAVQRGWRSSMFFVDYDKFCDKPKTVMADVYDFLRIPKFEHDFEHVEQVTQEDDRQWGWLDLHTIRQQVRPQGSQWQKVLGKLVGGQFERDARFWESL